MMGLSAHKRTIGLSAILLPLAVLFIYVVLRSGPLAPVPVTVTTVEKQSVTPALFGIGIIEARYIHRIGPIAAGRIQQVNVDVGDKVETGQVLSEIDPIDLDERINAHKAAVNRVRADMAAAEARVLDMTSRKDFARSQKRRYNQLLEPNLVSREVVDTKRQEDQTAEAGLLVSSANLEAARQELVRLEAEYSGLIRQRENLRMVSPVNGMVIGRYAEPGTTVVAGQPVVEVIDRNHLWVNVRFDQRDASGLRNGLGARIVLRSRSGNSFSGKILRVEPLADAVTEELLAKVVFDVLPDPVPPIGELAEVTVTLPELPPRPVVPNAAIHRVNGELGVWTAADGELRFVPVRVGASDPSGRVQIVEGLEIGQRVVVYSRKALTRQSRIRIKERLPGVTP